MLRTSLFLLQLQVLFGFCICIWPQPISYIQSSDSISIPLLCGVKLDIQSSQKISSNANSMINGAFNRALVNFQSQQIFNIIDCSTISIVTIKMAVKNPSHDSVNPTQDVVSDEAYQIIINGQGININATTTIAALRAAWTLFQVPTTNGIIKNSISINDYPSMVYRGLLVDTTRSINTKQGERQPILRLYEMIDKMEIVKFNILHWHLTDTDGLSFQYENVQVTDPYDPNEIKKLVEYSKQRGIALIPEVDIMGHTGTIWAKQTGISDFAPYDCPDQFNLDSPAALSFILNLYTYMFTNLFSGSPIFGTGQDEVAPCGNTYVKSTTLLQNQLNSIGKSNGNKSIMIWGDTILEQNLKFDTVNTLVAPWKIYEGYNSYSDGVNSLISKGYRVLIYNENPWYISSDTTASDLYNYNPLKNIPIKNQKNIIGGAAALWEPSLQDLENQIFWPMSVSVAEILWSNSSFTANGFNKQRKRYGDISSFIKFVRQSG